MRTAIVALFMLACAPGPLRTGDQAELVGTRDDPAGVASLPPISGGTLRLLDDGRVAVADPDGDSVYVVTIGSDAASDAILEWALEPGDEPGRIAEDADGRIHVVLRGAGEVATIDPAEADPVSRRAVCAEPRGIAYRAATDGLLVACTSGDLVSLPASGGAEIERHDLGVADLRDVVVDGDGLVWVSRFRSAQLLLVTDGRVDQSQTPMSQGLFETTPSTAWRTTVDGEGRVVMLLQADSLNELGTGAGAYYGSIVETNVFTFGGDPLPLVFGGTPVPVDVAIAGSGQVAVVSVGNRVVARTGTASSPSPLLGPFDSEPIAAVYDRADRLVIQLRDPTTLVLPDRTIALSTEPHHDAGAETFHLATAASGIACASCHPEGRDDGHTWDFALIGDRRTQSLRGGILATAPFHWNGDLATFHDLMDEVFVSRMSAPPPSEERETAVARWLDGLPAPVGEPRADAGSVERGRDLFYGEAACGGCHAGERYTNAQTVDVGTGGAFQVPSLLGVFERAPYLHDGRAPTLLDRFEVGGDRHGHTAGLDDQDRADLVAFLETL